MSLPFETLLPPSTLSRPAEAASILPSAAMMRVNFIPGVRQRLGWRGMRECPNHIHSLTARVAGMTGIYGLSLISCAAEGQQGSAEFALNYFPAVDEDRLNAFPIEACIAALADDYLERVRDFAGHDDMCSLFAIAKLVLIVDPDRGLSLRVRALDRAVIVASDAVIVNTPDGPRQILEPGGFDKDLRAFDLAMPFIDSLAASIGYTLAETPSYLVRTAAPAERWFYDGEGRTQHEAWADARTICLSFGWGRDVPMPIIDNTAETEMMWADPEPRPSDYDAALWWDPKTQGARHSLDKSTLGIQDKPKLIVLTGFLGAGKTSFLKRFIDYQAQRNGFVAIVQNEIGAKGLDAKLLGQHYAAVEIDEGCVCCTLAGSLKLALNEILQSYQPDFVVLETTGLANPANLLTEITDLEDQMEFASITTVLDAERGAETLAHYAVARDQIILADVILLNKVTSAGENQTADIEKIARRLNPTAPIHRLNHGDISPAALYGVNVMPQHALAKVDHVCACGHDHDHDANDCTCTHPHDHKYGKTHEDEGLESRIWPASSPLDLCTLQSAMDALPPNVLRVKGVVEIQGELAPQICQYVPGHHAISTAEHEDTGERFLMFIGEDIDAPLGIFSQTMMASCGSL